MARTTKRAGLLNTPQIGVSPKSVQGRIAPTSVRSLKCESVSRRSRVRWTVLIASAFSIVASMPAVVIVASSSLWESASRNMRSTG